MKFLSTSKQHDNPAPEGYEPVVAYAKGDKVLVLIDDLDEDDNHNCDWEGCSSIEHGVWFSVALKYSQEELQQVLLSSLAGLLPSDKKET